MTCRAITTFTDTEVEMGEYYYGFSRGLPRSPKFNDNIWVVVSWLTKLAHFLPIKIFKTDEIDKDFC